MSAIDDLVAKLLNGKGFREQHTDFTKYSNDKFEILVFDNRVIVTDKRTVRPVIYNNITIAKANLVGV